MLKQVKIKLELKTENLEIYYFSLAEEKELGETYTLGCSPFSTSSIVFPLLRKREKTPLSKWHILLTLFPMSSSDKDEE